MADEADEAGSKTVQGFPAIPAVGARAGSAQAPARDAQRCLEMLERSAPRSYGSEAIQLATIAVQDVHAEMSQLGKVPQETALAAFAEALGAFAPDADAGRRRRTTLEWVQRRAAPIDAMLQELGTLTGSAPDLSRQQLPGSEALATTYRRAHACVSELDTFIQAGRKRLGELTDRLRATLAEADADKDAAEAEAAALRKERDAVERRTHLLRIVRTQTGDFLEEVRQAVGLREALAERMRTLESVALPEWEARLRGFAQAAGDVARGRAPMDFAPVTEANARLRAAVQEALDRAAAFRAASHAAEAAAPGDFTAIERKVMGPGGEDGEA